MPCSRALSHFDETRHTYVENGGVRLHIARAGEGPPVILLHGFPENWRSWQHQIPALVNQGFSVWAVDLRGYNLSDKPLPSSDYGAEYLRADVAAVVEATGSEKAHLIGHDWGGVVAWDFAAHRPEKVDKLIILNAPHPNVFRKQLFSGRQIFRSWYVLFFQLPIVPEMILSAGDYYIVRRLLRRSKVFNDDEIRHYIDALAKPRALRSALNYYRANFWSWRQEQRLPIIDLSTLVIWGERDFALGTELLAGVENEVRRLEVRRFPDADHWVQNEKPEEVNSSIVKFLKPF